MGNRLNLDFSLETAEERNNFISTYIVQFVDEDGVPNLTKEELETIGNYLLWGKTTNGKALGAGTGLETKWTKKTTSEIESLESLMEMPGFTSSQIRSLEEATLYRKGRLSFSRAEARAQAPKALLPVFEELWHRIDEVDLLINLYEVRVGKRDKPPREELLKKFTEEELANLQVRADALTQFKYLKLRHEIVELRREQFTIRDAYVTSIQLERPLYSNNAARVTFEGDWEILPLGVKEGTLGEVIFNHEFDPAALNEEQLRSINKLVWEKKQVSEEKQKLDFRDLEFVYQLYLLKDEIKNQIEEDEENSVLESNLKELLDTLNFYEEEADLTDAQREILRLKEQHKKNSDIADYINKKYEKGYTANYISTIFRQKIIGKINEAAELHRETIENCFFPENFKKCTECGRILLLDGRNWVKKARSKDGFQNKCKRCEREKRKKMNKSNGEGGNQKKEVMNGK